MRKRRSKRDKQSSTTATSTTTTTTRSAKPKKASAALQKHGGDGNSGGIMALLPSLMGLAVLGCGIMAKMGFRGRASVAGIDLGTTNSVICVQAPAKGVGVIDCIPDPVTNSPIIPSVVSFLELAERLIGPKSKTPSLLYPHPSAVLVGQAAKKRIDSHPHHTLYNAKRVLGRTPDDPAVSELQHEVEFVIQPDENGDDDETPVGVAFTVPDSESPIAPQQVGAYVVNYLAQLTQDFLGHDNVKSAVICVPAKFNAHQRRQTALAFTQAGIKVARIVEEPTAAALAYGLHRKEGVDYILVYDFGGGTLDVSLLHVSDGFVDVMGSDGDDLLGGADFDAAVAHFLMGDTVVNGSETPVNQGKKEVVTRVATLLRQLAKQQTSTQGLDLEQQLAHSCPALTEIPLCTTSSFHTIGEQLKIALSEANTHNDDNEEESSTEDKSEESKVHATCLGLDDAAVEELQAHLTLDSFCKHLQPVHLEMTATEYQLVVQPLLDRSALPVKRLLHDLDLTEHDIDEVVMVGGTSRMPQIRSLVRQVLPSATLNTHIDPDITVAYGAASVID